MMCEMCNINVIIDNTDNVKLFQLCDKCARGTMYWKDYLILNYLNENAIKFLMYYYKTHITKARETEIYFMKYGGENWEEKYKSSKHYKYYQKCVNGSLFQEELKNIISTAFTDLSTIIKNEEINGIYNVECYSDIYYTYEQFEYCYKISCC